MSSACDGFRDISVLLGAKDILQGGPLQGGRINGTRRRCRSVWRSDDEVGMSYLGPLKSRNEQGHEPPPNRNPVVAFSLRSLPGAGFDGEETNSRQTPFSFFPRQPLSSHGI